MEEVRHTEMLAEFARLRGAVATLGADQQGAAALQTRMEEAEAAHNSGAARLRAQVADAINEAAALRAEMAEQGTEKAQLATDLRASQDDCAELAGLLEAANASLTSERAVSAAAHQATEGLRASLLECEGELGAAQRDMVMRAASLFDLWKSSLQVQQEAAPIVRPLATPPHRAYPHHSRHDCVWEYR